MFILNCQSGSKAFYILENNKQHIVGRKGCGFLITGDTSISKKHALVTLKSGTLEIEDIGSTYNTFVNKVKLEEKKPVVLKHGDIIQFGILKSIYKVEEKKIIVICSGLSNANKKKLAQIIKDLNGKLLTSWSSDLSYLTVDKILLTMKVLSAIIEGLPVVSLEFWEQFIQSVENNLPPPLESQYLPKPSDMTHKNLSFDYKPERKTLFNGKIFVFKKKSNLKDIIISAGGKCILYTDEKITKSKLQGYDPQYLLVQEEEPTQDSFHPFNKLIASLSDLNKRAIPQPEIALAIVVCSCKTNCNPDFDRVGSLLQGTSEMMLPSHPLVAGTEDMDKETQDLIATAKNVIPDSFQSQPITIPKNIVGTKQMEIIEIDEDAQETDDVVVVEPVIFKKETLNTDGRVKRVAEADILNKETKRKKVDDKKQRTSPSTSKSKNSKVTDFFTSTPTESAGETSILNKLPSLSQISKRKSSETEDEKPMTGKRPKLFKNPFAPANEPSTSTVSKNSTKRTAICIARQEPTRIKTEENFNYTVQSLSNVYQNLFQWRSANDEPEIKVKEDPSDAMKILSESLKNCVVVTNESVVIQKDYSTLGHDVTCSEKPTSFKKFNRVKPLHMQMTIISNCTDVVCGNTSSVHVSYANDDFCEE